jgi:hypothetical protein
MHVTSDYYRSREHQPEEEMGLVERWGSSVQNARKGLGAEPLRPSRSTLRRLARHYENSHALKHSA